MNFDDTTPYEARQQGRQAYHDGAPSDADRAQLDGVRALEEAWSAGWNEARKADPIGWHDEEGYLLGEPEPDVEVTK